MNIALAEIQQGQIDKRGVSMMERPGGKEVNSVLGYIGGEGGYLGNFTYASHSQFYPMYCGVDIDPNELSGTTRQRFTTILSKSEPLITVKDSTRSNR